MAARLDREKVMSGSDALNAPELYSEDLTWVDLKATAMRAPMSVGSWPR